MATTEHAAGTDGRRSLTTARGTRAARERLIVGALAACSILSIATTIGIVVALAVPALEFFGDVPVSEFFSGDRWAPTFTPASFNVPPLLAGTLSTTLWACALALPFGLGIAIYLSEYARPRVRAVLKPVLELLAGIPTVVFGYFALTLVTPLLRDTLGFESFGMGPFSALAAGLVIGVMLLPTVASVSEDAMQAVPNALRFGAFALGSNRLQVATRVVVPAAISGIVSSFVLAISRAVGETMIVLIAAGGKPQLTLNPVEQVQTMTAFIGSIAQGDVPTGSTEYKTIFAVALLLFVITLVLNLFAIRLVRRFRETYE